MTHALEYNSERSQLIIPEYGRHIQKMVEHAIEVEDDEKRNRIAKTIIAVMGNLNPHLRDVSDFQHKLWDQLFIISDFKLDVESPFPKPTREILAERPEPMPYPKNFTKYRFYGNNIKKMIEVASEWEEGDMRDALVYSIANHMKKSYLNWNKDSVEDEVIFQHLKELSAGQIDVKPEEEDLSQASELLKDTRKTSRKPTKKVHRSRNRKRH